MNKRRELAQLARLRRESRWDGYGCIGDYHGGVYECEFVSPYTKSAGNVDAEIMVLLQDWASADALSAPVDQDRVVFGLDPRRATNTRLQDLLRRHFDMEMHNVYATNLFPFVKPGAMNAKIRSADLRRAAREFALPQVRIVRPLLAVCLGKDTYNAIAVAAGHPSAETVARAVARPLDLGETRVWCSAHTGPLGINRRGIDTVNADWAAMADEFRRRKTRRGAPQP
jgi:uracil-DNA glycosylase